MAYVNRQLSALKIFWRGRSYGSIPPRLTTGLTPRLTTGLMPGLITGPALSGLMVGLALLGLIGSIFVTIYAAGTDSLSLNDLAVVLPILKISLLQAGLSMGLSMVLGLALAWSLSHQRSFPGRKILVSLLSVSMVLPSLVAVLGLVSVFGRNGWISNILESLQSPHILGLGSFIYGLSGIVLAHIFMNAPFVARGLLQRLDHLPTDRLKLSSSLGLSAWQQFRIVEWPALRTSFFSLSATVFLLCFTSFAIVLTLGGSPKYNTLEVAIYEAVKLEFDLNRAVLLAVLQVVICGALVILASSMRGDDKSFGLIARTVPWISNTRTRTIQLSIIIAFSLFFLSPFAAILWDGLAVNFFKLGGEAIFQKALITSLILASLSSALTVLAALAIGGTQRSIRSPLRVDIKWYHTIISSMLSFSGSIYLAVPSLVLGLGFFLIARALTTDVYSLAPLALILANLLLALPFALVILVPAMEKLTTRYDKLAFALGVRGLARWRMVEWPGLRGEIGFVAALSFCFSLGDLGVIALFGNRDFATLPWLLFQKMGSYRTDDAAGIALILLALTLAVFYLMPRIFEETK